MAHFGDIVWGAAMKIFRRQEKKKNNRRAQQKNDVPQVSCWHISPRLMTWLGTLFVLIAITYAVGLKLLDPTTLQFQQVRLEAPFKNVSKIALHDAVKTNIDGGFFSLNVEAVTTAVNSLPWVRDAKVRRVWPDTLHVTVREQMALARWRDQALVNVAGELFYPSVESFPADLIELNGPAKTVSQMARQFRLFNKTLNQAGYALKRIKLTQRRAWEVELDDTTLIVLGRDDLEQRLKRFVQFYPQLQKRGVELERVDMRYTNGFAVRMKTSSESIGDKA